MIYSEDVKEVIKMLGDNIRYLRLKQGLSQDFLADKLGYKSYTTIQKWESGVSEPPVKKLKELASIFNIDMDDLASKNLQDENNNNLISQKPYIDLSMNTYKIIKNRRLELGLTLEDVANALGVSEATVQRYESGDIKNIKHDTIAHLAEILKCSPSYLMGWEDDKSDFVLSNEEKELIIEYRKADSVSREAVQRLLLYYSKISGSDPYADIPASPEELEKKYPPVDIDDVKGKIG